jgi:hypothetical protein
MKNLSEDNLSPSRDSKHTPLEYKSVALPGEPMFTVERKQLPFPECAKNGEVRVLLNTTFERVWGNGGIDPRILDLSTRWR